MSKKIALLCASSVVTSIVIAQEKAPENKNNPARLEAESPTKQGANKAIKKNTVKLGEKKKAGDPSLEDLLGKEDLNLPPENMPKVNPDEEKPEGWWLLPNLNDPLIPIPEQKVPQDSKPSKDDAITLEEDPEHPLDISRYRKIPLRGIMLIKDKRVGMLADESDPVMPMQKDVKGVVITPLLLGLPKPLLLRKKLSKYVLPMSIKEKKGAELTYGELEQMVKEIHKHYVDNGYPLVHVYVPVQEVSDSIQIAIMEGAITKATVTNVKDVDSKKLKDRWNNWYNKPYDVEDLSKKLNDKIEEKRNLQPNELAGLFEEVLDSPWSRLNRKQKHPFIQMKGTLRPLKGVVPRKAELVTDPAANPSKQPDALKKLKGKEGLLLGKTELVVSVKQTRPLNLFMGYDNSLTEILGGDRFYIGGVWYDAFKLNKNHQFGLQLFSATRPKALSGFAASYMIPWGEDKKHFSEFYATYVTSSADVISAGIPTTFGGDSIIVGGMHWMALPDIIEGGDLIPGTALLEYKHKDRRFYRGLKKSRQSFGIYHEAGAGLDFKSADNTLEFGGTQISDTNAIISQLVLGYNARQTDKKGETNLQWRGFVGLGGSNQNTMNDLRSGAKPQYFYTNLEITREQDLPFGAFAKAKLKAQYSTHNLLASEQMGFGGTNTIRGYAERAYRGDNGIQFNAEIFSPAFHPLSKVGLIKGANEELRFLAFFDFGVGSAADEIVATDASQTLMSVGLGFRYNYDDNLSLRCDWGMPLKDLDSPPFDAKASDSRFHVGGVWTF